MAAVAEHVDDEQDRFFTLSLDLLCICRMDGHLRRINPAFVHMSAVRDNALKSRPSSQGDWL